MKEKKILTALIVDDEELARTRFRTLLDTTGRDVHVVGETGNPLEAVNLIKDIQPDVVFLDIQMPGLDGFDVVDLVGKEPPHIIFVTAYDEYAIKAFEVHAIDYLTKPVRLERLQKCIDRLMELTVAVQSGKAIKSLIESRASNELKRISTQSARGIKIIELSDIRYFEATEKLVFVHTKEKRAQVDFTIDELENRLPAMDFLRIHRSYIVSVTCIKTIEAAQSGNWLATLDNGTALTVARRRVNDIKKLIGLK